MTDLVKRLRDERNQSDTWCRSRCHEAADRIEELEAALAWRPIMDLEHGHIDDRHITLPNGSPCPASFESDEVLLTDGASQWVGRSMVVGGVLVEWGGKRPTHWKPLDEPPKRDE